MRFLIEPAPDGMDYVGRKSCGCVVAWCSGNQAKRHLASCVSRMIRDGLTVERMTTEESRRVLKSCKCGAPAEQAPLFEAAP